RAVFVNRLDPAELVRIAGEFDNNREKIATALRDFEAEVAVIGMKWQGRAGVSFQNVAENWRQLQQNLTNLLRQTADDVRVVAGQSRVANAQAEADIRIDLPLDGRN